MAATFAWALAVGAQGTSIGGDIGTSEQGGYGAMLAADVPLPADTSALYVEVGGVGGAASAFPWASGGFDGGGVYGGGGASDIRTVVVARRPYSQTRPATAPISVTRAPRSGTRGAWALVARAPCSSARHRLTAAAEAACMAAGAAACMAAGAAAIELPWVSRRL
jgi:hypothetical protein